MSIDIVTIFHILPEFHMDNFSYEKSRRAAKPICLHQTILFLCRTYLGNCVPSSVYVLKALCKHLSRLRKRLVKIFRKCLTDSLVLSLSLLNDIRSGMYNYYRELLERETGLPVLGYLPHLPEVQLESRHLGLMTAGEVEQLDEKIRLLGETAAETLELSRIMELAKTAPPLPDVPPYTTKPKLFRLGVAQDKAFCFTYAENLELLEQCGAELVYFSPLTGAKLPENLDGLYFCGGYPELYLPRLSGNTAFLESLRRLAGTGIPILGECGGFLYLQRSMTGKDGKSYPLAGLLPGTSRLGERLCRFGYVTLTAQQDTILGKAGTKIRAHEFHYADSTENGSAFLAQRPNGRTWQAVQTKAQIIAGFPHLYFPSNPEVPQHFADACKAYRKERLSC